MDRLRTLSTSRANEERRLSMETVIYTVVKYMEEQKVETDKAQMFVQSVLSHPIECGTLIMDCFTVALQYFEKKFGIFKLYSKDRKLIAIY